MIYLDTSAALAHLLAEDRHPPDSLWAQTIASSRLLEYEMWTRINNRRLYDSHGPLVRDFLARVAIVELSPPVLSRALEPFPMPVRTLDALHLASMEFLRAQHQEIVLASYDERLSAAAVKMGFPLAEI